jgi:pimeloyl-ACP methyl ester carboxylesterase
MTDFDTTQRPAGDRETLVFLHGSGDSATLWSRLLPLLKDYPTLALDLPGHGAQADRPGPAEMTVADYADSVRSMLARQQLNEVCLVGHSLGSAIALRLAVEYPSIVCRLVLIGAGARLRVLPEVLQQARTAPAPALHRLVSLGFAPGHEDQAEAYFEAMAPTAPGMLHRDLAACDSFDMMEDLGRVAQPTLILVGDTDRLTPPKYARYLADHLARAALTTIPDVGHYLPVEAPQAVAIAMREWLSRAYAPVEQGA